ncbi:MAG: hypothetical protein [Microvirus sp.]|nr:MAG: hypothetical protein [Microvirus sp.]
MRPVSRHHVNKHKSARSFRGKVATTHPKNMSLRPMRGGWRL